MKSTKSAIRYAKALLEMAVEKKAVDAILSDMQQITQMAESSRDFIIFLSSPVINEDKKITMLNKL